MVHFIAIFSGVIFGFGIILSGMVNPSIVLAFLGLGAGWAGLSQEAPDPLILRVDNATGNVDLVTTMKEQETSYGEVVDSYFLNKYVLNRESYDYDTIQTLYDTTALLSNDRPRMPDSTSASRERRVSTYWRTRPNVSSPTRFTASKPSIFGITTSMRMRSGFSASAFATPSCPSLASTTSYWFFARIIFSIRRTVDESSTSRIFFLGMVTFRARAASWPALQGRHQRGSTRRRRKETSARDPWVRCP